VTTVSVKSFDRLVIVAVALVIELAAGRVAAQPAVVAPVESLSFDRPEAWAMKYFASASLLEGLQSPEKLPSGSVRVGVEIGWLPRLSTAQERVGFFGTSPDDLNKAPVFGRPRVTVSLPRAFSLTVAGTPPVRAFGITPKLIAGALQRPVLDRGGWVVGWRAAGQSGTVTGAFTCWADLVARGPDSPDNPEGCVAESSDTVTLRYVGGAIDAARRVTGSRWVPQASAGVTYVDSVFQVNAPTKGFLDRTRLESRGAAFSASLGLTYAMTGRLAIGGEVFYSPLTVQRGIGAPRTIDGLLNARALLTYRVH
jgi:hypothetical protein